MKVKGREVHWLDSVGQELWEELHTESLSAREALSDKVPLGTIEQLPEEQLSNFLSMSPEELQMIRQTVGDEEFQGYMTAMGELANKKLGALSGLFEIFNQ